MRARSGAPQPSAQEPGRRLRTRRRCRWDAVTDLEHGAALPTPPPPPPAVRDSGGRLRSATSPTFPWAEATVRALAGLPAKGGPHPLPQREGDSARFAGLRAVPPRSDRSSDAGSAGLPPPLPLGSSAPCPSGSRRLSSAFTADCKRARRSLERLWKHEGH